MLQTKALTVDLFVVRAGFVLPVLSYVKERATVQGVDQVQMRFFLAKVIEVAAPKGVSARDVRPHLSSLSSTLQ